MGVLSWTLWWLMEGRLRSENGFGGTERTTGGGGGWTGAVDVDGVAVDVISD